MRPLVNLRREVLLTGLVFVCLFFCGCQTPRQQAAVLSGAPKLAATKTKAADNQRELQRILVEQQDFLCRKLGIVFNDDITIEFGESKNQYYPNQVAWYLFFSSKILISPSYVTDLTEPADRFEIAATVRHELGHAYCNQVSLQLGQGFWPPLYDDDAKPFSKEWRAVIGSSILGEGMAEVFESLTVSQEITAKGVLVEFLPKASLHIPVSDHDLVWNDKRRVARIMYDGGLSLVAPIAENRGLIDAANYVVTHPLRFDDGNLLRAMQEYVFAATVRFPTDW